MKKQNGQTLVEVLVALVIATLVIMAMVVAVTWGVKNAQFAKNQSQATKFAQEGMETVRAYRDQNPWATFVSGCETPTGLTAAPAPFSRVIDCHLQGLPDNCSSANNTCEVKVTVSWTDGSGTHKSEQVSYFTNWQ